MPFVLPNWIQVVMALGPPLLAIALGGRAERRLGAVAVANFAVCGWASAHFLRPNGLMGAASPAAYAWIAPADAILFVAAALVCMTARRWWPFLFASCCLVGLAVDVAPVITPLNVWAVGTAGLVLAWIQNLALVHGAVSHWRESRSSQPTLRHA
jgi:hypothetical protein